MSFPSAPDFTAAADDAAWWLIAGTDASGNNQYILCTTNGRAFVDQIQSLLGVTMDGRWGANTSAALLAQVRTLSPPPQLATAIQAEAANQQVGLGTIWGAIWYLHQQIPIGDAALGIAYTQIAWLPGVTPIYPQWDVASTLGPGGEINPTCSITQMVPSTPVSTPAAPTASVDGGTTGQGISQTPITVPSPVQTAAADLGVTTLNAQGSPTGTILQSGSSIPWPLVIGGAAILGFVGWFAWSSTRTKQPSQRRVVRTNPRRRHVMR